MTLPRILAVLATCCAAPVAAQGVFDMGALTNTLSIPSGTPSRKSPKAPVDRAPSSGAARGADIRLTYTVTPALRRAALDGYLSRMARQEPEAARAMAAQFASHDYAAVYRDMMKGSQLRDDDAVDAVLAYTLLGWQIANQFKGEISDRRAAAVRRQIAPGLAANPRLSAPGTRARLGEEMKLLSITLHAGWQGAAKEGNIQRYSDGIAAKFKTQSGRDLRAFTLTDAGFTRR